MVVHTLSKPVTQAVNELIQFIGNNLLNRERVSTLFPHYYSKRNTIHPAFKVVTGHPIDEYRTFKLMEAAAVMMADGELAMRQVACKCGFNSKRIVPLSIL